MKTVQDSLFDIRLTTTYVLVGRQSYKRSALSHLPSYKYRFKGMSS